MKWTKIEQRKPRFNGDYTWYVKFAKSQKFPKGSSLGPIATKEQAKKIAKEYRNL